MCIRDSYTVQEAMKKYSLSRDSVFGFLQFHKIKREKKGRFVRFLKVEFDHVTVSYTHLILFKIHQCLKYYIQTLLRCYLSLHTKHHH